MVRSYQVMGLELGAWVLDWGQVESVKDILLAQNQLFTAEHTVKLANPDGRFSPLNSKSPFFGKSLQIQGMVLSLDGSNLFTGFIRSVTPDHASRSVTIKAENIFTKPANSTASLTASGVNPAAAIKTLLTNAGLGAYLDTGSFISSAATFSFAGATINVAYDSSNKTTVLSAVQAICSLCGLSCFVQNGMIRLSPWRAYQGNLSGIKHQVTASAALSFGTLTQAYQNLSNSVTIGYGASSSVTLYNKTSIKVNSLEINTPFSTNTGSVLAVPDLISATYFGQQFLSRASNLREEGTLVVGPELLDTVIGDRLTISAPNWSDSPVAVEVIETHPSLDDATTGLVVATI